jgi:hypothetical protein
LSVPAQPSGSDPGPTSLGLDSEREIRFSARWLGLLGVAPRPSITFIIVRIEAGTHHSTVAWETKSPLRYRSIANRPGLAGGSSVDGAGVGGAVEVALGDGAPAGDGDQDDGARNGAAVGDDVSMKLPGVAVGRAAGAGVARAVGCPAVGSRIDGPAQPPTTARTSQIEIGGRSEARDADREVMAGWPSSGVRAVYRTGVNPGPGVDDVP